MRGRFARHNVTVPLPQLRSPFARAVVPVLGGAALFAALALFMWGMAAWISRGGADTSERIAPSAF